MLWVDKTNKQCKSAEDWNFFPGEDGWIGRYKELKFQYLEPVACMGYYDRSIPFHEFGTFGRFICVGMGRENTKGKGGYRKTYINSYS